MGYECFRAIEAGTRRLIIARGGTRSERLSRAGDRHTRAVESELVSDGKNKAVILTEASSAPNRPAAGNPSERRNTRMSGVKISQRAGSLA